jgi:hypothetical protein
MNPRHSWIPITGNDESPGETGTSLHGDWLAFARVGWIVLVIPALLIFVASIILLQYLLRGIINQNNNVAIVVSTLAIAALFRPLRKLLQTSIDRRFYRRKYDAARTLTAFSATLRNEVDLHQLRERLVTVVEETMQPTHVSLWLRKDEQRRTPNTDV